MQKGSNWQAMWAAIGSEVLTQKRLEVYACMGLFLPLSSLCIRLTQGGNAVAFSCLSSYVLHVEDNFIHDGCLLMISIVGFS